MKVVLIGIDFLEKAKKEFIEILAKWQYQIAEVKVTTDIATRIARERPDLLLIHSEAVPTIGQNILQSMGEQFPNCTIVFEASARPNRVMRNILAHGGSIPSKNGRMSKNIFNSYYNLDAGRNTLDYSLDFIRFLDQQDNEESPTNQDTPSELIESNGSSAKLLYRQPRVVLPELHDPNNGRIDAERIASYLVIPLSKLANGLKVNYGTVHKTPSAESLQSTLRPIKRSLEILTEVVGNRETVLAWLNSPHPDLDKETPLQLIQEGRAEELEAILENAVAAIPY